MELVIFSILTYTIGMFVGFKSGKLKGIEESFGFLNFIAPRLEQRRTQQKDRVLTDDEMYKFVLEQYIEYKGKK